MIEAHYITLQAELLKMVLEQTGSVLDDGLD